VYHVIAVPDEEGDPSMTDVRITIVDDVCG
jgi:hypothetical protein